MNGKETYMSKQEVLNDFLNRIKIDESYEMFNANEINKFIKNKLKSIINELYDLSKLKVSYLSEKDTYIIRKIYGILDNGLCNPAIKLEKELNISNIGSIKRNYFIRVNKDLTKLLDYYNFEKKKETFINFIGIDSKYLRINAVVFSDIIPNYFINVYEYLKEISLFKKVDL